MTNAIDKNKVSPLSAGAIYVLFIISNIQHVNLFAYGKENQWLGTLIAVFVSAPFILVFMRLHSLYPNESLFGVIYKSLGKPVGIIVSLLYVFYAIFVGAATMRYLGEFIQIVSLENTPKFIVFLFFGYLCSRALKNGIGSFSRLCRCLFPVVILIYLLIIVLSVDLYDFSYLRPITQENLSDAFSLGMMFSAVSYGQIIFFLSIFSEVINKKHSESIGMKKKSVYKIVFWGTLICAIKISLVMLSNLLVLGEPTISRLFYPCYVTVSLININDLITHIEVVAVVSFILTSVVKITVCLYNASVGFKKIFSLKKSEDLLYPIAFSVIITALLLFNDPLAMLSLIESVKFFGLFFQISIPLLMLFFAEIKTRRLKKC